MDRFRDEKGGDSRNLFKRRSRKQAKQEKTEVKPVEEPLRLFLSYSHKDKAHKDIFVDNLTVMQQKQFIAPWHDGLIMPGTRWKQEIEENLLKMHVFVGLLTTAFLASHFIQTVELKAARAKHGMTGGDFLFVLILVDDVPLDGLDLAEYQILKPSGKAVTQHVNRRAGFDRAQAELEYLFKNR